MEIFKDLGRIAIGTRVRFLGDRITADAGKIYELYGIKMNPKWFPVFYILSKDPGRTITAIAESIGHSHVSVSKIVTEMCRERLVQVKVSPDDRRQTLVSLSRKGEAIAGTIEVQYLDVQKAVEELSQDSTHDLWLALMEWEKLLKEKSLFERVQEHKKIRESSQIKIVDYEPKYLSAFQKFNIDWIQTYFRMEKADHLALDNPHDYILSKGGYIFVALKGDRPVGVCALLKHDNPLYPYELAKMAVSRESQGNGIGLALGNAVIDKARALKAKRLYLESNTVLEPAIRLYRKLGFTEIKGLETPYERCNIQMELQF